MSRPLVRGLLAALLATSALAQDRAEEDALDLVALLVRDGRFDRAEVALREVPVRRLKGSDLVRWRTLEGLVLAGTERWDEAAAAFHAAREADAADRADPAVDPTLWLQEAQALVHAGRPADAVAVLDGASEEVWSLSPAWLLRARAAAEAGDDDGAWEALAAGAARFPDHLDFPRQQVLLLVRLGLYREASDRGGALFARPEATVFDVMVLADALDRAGDREHAADVLAQGRLRFPDRLEPWVRSATLALTRQRPAEAAWYLQVAAELDPKLAHEAAEVWRRAGDLGQAMRHNAEVLDPTLKTRQRLGLLLELEAWDQVLALQDRAARLGLLDDDAVAYGLAYARFRTSDLDGAEALLRRITDARAYEQATELRRAMDACRADSGACP